MHIETPADMPLIDPEERRTFTHLLTSSRTAALDYLVSYLNGLSTNPANVTLGFQHLTYICRLSGISVALLFEACNAVTLVPTSLDAARNGDWECCLPRCRFARILDHLLPSSL